MHSNIVATIKDLVAHDDVFGSSVVMSLGMDSFKSMELMARLKGDLGVELKASIFTPELTVADVVRTAQSQLGVSKSSALARPSPVQAAAPQPAPASHPPAHPAPPAAYKRAAKEAEVEGPLIKPRSIPQEITTTAATVTSGETSPGESTPSNSEATSDMPTGPVVETRQCIPSYRCKCSNQMQ